MGEGGAELGGVRVAPPGGVREFNDMLGSMERTSVVEVLDRLLRLPLRPWSMSLTGNDGYISCTGGRLRTLIKLRLKTLSFSMVDRFLINSMAWLKRYSSRLLRATSRMWFSSTRRSWPMSLRLERTSNALEKRGSSSVSSKRTRRQKLPFPLLMMLFTRKWTMPACAFLSKRVKFVMISKVSHLTLRRLMRDEFFTSLGPSRPCGA
mmetsp:Transcript_23932/g.67937  ORF Transcript_23932/g.67937 Transcript_23932/m.67937 type:complete len:207 (+) Transcript_23932:914-1534(+)